MTGLERYRVDPPRDDAAPRRCPRHPDEDAVYVRIPIRILDTESPAAVRGWTCPRCWTARGVVLERREPVEAVGLRWDDPALEVPC